MKYYEGWHTNQKGTRDTRAKRGQRIVSGSRENKRCLKESDTNSYEITIISTNKDSV